VLQTSNKVFLGLVGPTNALLDHSYCLKTGKNAGLGAGSVLSGIAYPSSKLLTFELFLRGRRSAHNVSLCLVRHCLQRSFAVLRSVVISGDCATLVPKELCP
jgi:hypothetical protein